MKEVKANLYLNEFINNLRQYLENNFQNDVKMIEYKFGSIKNLTILQRIIKKRIFRHKIDYKKIAEIIFDYDLSPTIRVYDKKIYNKLRIFAISNKVKYLVKCW